MELYKPQSNNTGPRSSSIIKNNVSEQKQIIIIIYIVFWVWLARDAPDIQPFWYPISGIVSNLVSALAGYPARNSIK